MPTYKEILQEKRRKAAEDKLKKRMDRAVGKDPTPSMIAGFEDSHEQEQIPDIRELDIPHADMSVLARSVEELAGLNMAKAAIIKRIKELTPGIKLACNDYSISKAMADDNRINYFKVEKRTINPTKLLENGVSPRIIAACTDTKDVWMLKVTSPKRGQVDEEEEGY